MMVVEWATAAAVFTGESVSGDRAVVVGFPRGTLVAMIDGLGHGPAAAEAAGQAAEVLEQAPGVEASELIVRCHERMRRSRGAAISLASFDAASARMTWIGVGNVEGVFVQVSGAAHSLATRGGTVGYLLPALRTQTIDVKPGDTLAFATDGIEVGFRQHILPGRSPDEIANAILAGHDKHNDDACVVVARYLGQTGEGPAT
jgi:negative regulator of sigma-B (phosphoserine phosphatase)